MVVVPLLIEGLKGEELRARLSKEYGDAVGL